MPTVDQLTTHVRDIIASKRSPCTRQAYQRDWDAWLHYCSTNALSPLTPSLAASASFRDAFLADDKRATCRRALSTLSSIYETLWRERLVETNVFHPRLLPWPKASHANRTKAIPSEIAEQIIDAARGAGRPAMRDFTILRLLWDTGLRRSSVQTLRHDAIEMGRAPHPTKLRVIVKGDYETSVELPASAEIALVRWVHENKAAVSSPWVFPSAKDRKKPIHETTMNDIVKKWAKKVGAGWVHPHCFRAAFVTDAFDAGVETSHIRASVHHANETTTLGYDRGARGRGVVDRVAEWRKSKEEK